MPSCFFDSTALRVMLFHLEFRWLFLRIWPLLYHFLFRGWCRWSFRKNRFSPFLKHDTFQRLFVVLLRQYSGSWFDCCCRYGFPGWLWCNWWRIVRCTGSCSDGSFIWMIDLSVGHNIDRGYDMLRTLWNLSLLRRLFLCAVVPLLLAALVQNLGT
jgi:hypothetical protein